MNGSIFMIGTFDLNRKLLEIQKLKRRRLDITVIGILTIADDITPDLIDATVGRVSVRGSIRGPAAAAKALQAKIR